MHTDRIRVAFTLIGGKNWTGGYNYLLNLVRALAVHSPEALVPVMFFGEDTALADMAPFCDVVGVEVVRTPVFDEARRSGALVRSLLLGRDAKVQAAFRQQRIDVVFEAAQFHGWRMPLPAVAWIPDFQHRFLPHLFGRAGYWKRELGFRAQVASGRIIMLSSEDSRRACEHFYPASIGRTRTVRFAVPARPQVGAKQARAVADRYGLPQRFFFLPNQFWQHKNHLLVLEALALLNARGRSDIVVVASGKTLDPRNSAYFPRVESSIKALELESTFKIIGLIPYGDLAPLMVASQALLNPSNFEGWSTTVEEARALGVPMILSDLDVHKEQGGASATYFDRSSAESLATALHSFVAPSEQDRYLLAHEAHRVATDRVQAFAATFVSLVKSCNKSRRN